MSNDSSRLQNDLMTTLSIMFPEAPQDQISVRLEEILYRYNIEHKAMSELKNDMISNIELFLSAKRLEGNADNTLEGYRLELMLFHRFVNKATVQIQTPDIRKYLASIEGVMTSTIGKKLTALKSFFSWLVQEEIILRDPTRKIRPPKIPKRLPKSLTVDELELVRETCNSKRERALIEVFYSTGCRLSELASMDISRIDYQNMSTTVIGKGDKERRVYLTFKAIYHLKKYLMQRYDDCDALFVTYRRPIRRMSNNAIRDEIDNIEKRVNLKNKKLHPHVMRHTLAQTMLDNGAALEEVQHILGHSNISTTQVYTHVSEERKQSAHKRYA